MRSAMKAFLVCLLFGIVVSPGGANSQGEGKVDQSLPATFVQLPMAFEPNQGQADEEVRFISRGSGYTLFLTSEEAVLLLRERDAGKTPASAVRMRLVGADSGSAIIGLQELPGKSSYFIGSDPEKWRTNLPTYARVRYQNVYPGIDLVHYGNQRRWEHDFIVAPGADPDSIKVSLEGPDRVEIDTNGDLVLDTSTGEVRLRKPVIYQEIDGRRQTVPGGYLLNPESQVVGFQLAAYDDSKTLVIDPVLELGYSSYLGGMGEDSARGIAIDGEGNVYVAGSTTSGATLPGPATQVPPAAGDDGFVVKIDSSGALAYSVYFGGTGDESARGIVPAPSGTVYVVGHTRSSDFPTTPDAFDRGLDPNKLGGTDLDGFVLALAPFSGQLQYSTYLGGSRDDLALGVAVTPSLLPNTVNSVFVTGTTHSADFPADNAQSALTTLSIDVNNPLLARDAFVVKLDISTPFNESSCNINGIQYSDCHDFDYGVYLGGQSSEDGLGIIVGSESTGPFVTGQTCSDDFPTPPSATPFSTQYGGGCDAFLAELGTNNQGIARLEYATYLGGSSWDLARGISFSPWGIVVTGETISMDFPVSSSNFGFPGTYQETHGGGTYDVFVAALSAGNSSFVSCPIGQVQYNNCADLTYSTFLGGVGDDYGYAVAADPSGVYVTGQGCSTTAPMTGFPLVDPLPEDPVAHLHDGTLCDAFISKFNLSGTDLVYSTYLGGSGADRGSGIAVNPFGEVYVAGTTGSANFPQEGNTLQPNAGIGNDAFVAKITLSCTGGGGPLAYTGDGRIIDTANDCLLTETVPGALVPGLTDRAPGAVAVRPDGAEVYGLERDSLNNLQNVVVFDTATKQVHKVPIPVEDVVGPGPEALVVSPDGTKLFVVVHEDKNDNQGGNRSDIYVMDTETHGLTVLHSGKAAENFDGVAVHPDGTQVYATRREQKKVTRIDTETSEALDIVVGTQPSPVLVTPDGQWAYVGNTFANAKTVSVIGADRNTSEYGMKVKDISVGGVPSDLAVTPQPVDGHGHLVYVAMGPFGVAVIDTNVKDVVVPAVPGAFGSDVTVSPDGTKVYVASESVVQVIEVVDENGTVSNKVVGAIVGVGGRVTAIGPQDRDGDGIIDQVDTDQTFSDDFSDGISSGFIMIRADQHVTVWDAFGNGLFANARGGTEKAHIVACGQGVDLDQNDAVKFLCGSLTLEVPPWASRGRLRR